MKKLAAFLVVVLSLVVPSVVSAEPLIDSTIRVIPEKPIPPVEDPISVLSVQVLHSSYFHIETEGWKGRKEVSEETDEQGKKQYFLTAYATKDGKEFTVFRYEIEQEYKIEYVVRSQHKGYEIEATSKDGAYLLVDVYSSLLVRRPLDDPNGIIKYKGIETAGYEAIIENGQLVFLPEYLKEKWYEVVDGKLRVYFFKAYDRETPDDFYTFGWHVNMDQDPDHDYSVDVSYYPCSPDASDCDLIKISRWEKYGPGPFTGRALDIELLNPNYQFTASGNREGVLEEITAITRSDLPFPNQPVRIVMQQDFIGLQIGELGDLNFDGKVDLTDFGTVKANFGKANPSYADGDLDGDGDIDLNDFAKIKANFGKEKPIVFEDLSKIIPEPITN